MVHVVKTVSYVLTLTSFGEVGLVWALRESTPSILRIFLPPAGLATRALIHLYFPCAVRQSHEVIDRVCLQIREYLSGVPVVFSFANLDISSCSGFQRKVLLQNRQIPRGFVSTYGRLAGKLSIPKGARAVGRALAANPFPLIIPCHRVVRLDGTPGGYGGGLRMKVALLEMEGVAFDARGRVQPEYFS